MALETPTHLTAAAVETDVSTTDLTSGAFTPPANALLIVAAFGALAGGPSPNFTLTNTAGLTFTRIAQAQGNALGGFSTAAVWVATTGAAPSSMTVTRQTSAATIRSGLFAVAVTDDSGNAPVFVSGQVDDVATTGDSMTAMLPNTPASTSAVIGVSWVGPGTTGPTPGTGFTEFVEIVVEAAASQAVMQAQYDLGNAADSCSWSGLPAGGSIKLGIAFEVAEPAVEETSIAPHAMHYARLRAA